MPAHPLLDAVNLRLLRELLDEPRLPMSVLARRVGMSSPAVNERLRRMEDAGVITGYRVDVNPAALGLPITVIIRVRPNPGQLPRIAEMARQIPEVTECHRVTGDDCFILKAFIPTIDQLDGILDLLLLHGTTTTSIVQSSPVPPRTLPIPDAVESC